MNLELSREYDANIDSTNGSVRHEKYLLLQLVEYTSQGDITIGQVEVTKEDIEWIMSSEM
jgi:hypothetical protein